MLIKKTDIKKTTFSDGRKFIPDAGRAQQLGEVFTPWWVVNKMINDLGIVRDHSTATVIEPASGTGNFGIEIIAVKLKQVLNEIKQDKILDNDFTKEYEIRSLLAISSLYCNDIDQSNILKLKDRYKQYILVCYVKYCKNKIIPSYYCRAIDKILETNILKYDFLKLRSNINKNNKQTNDLCLSLPYYFRLSNDSNIVYQIYLDLYKMIGYFESIEKRRQIQTNLLIDSDNNLKSFIRIFNDIDFNFYDYQNWYNNINKNKILLKYDLKQQKPIIFRDNNSMMNNKNKIDQEIYNNISKKILEKFNKPENFRFKYCISNPPYQQNISKTIDSFNKDQAIPLYHHFFLTSLSLSLSSSIICPARWKTGGRGLDDFREFIYKNHNITSIILFNKSSELFPTASIAGGISIINWQYNWNKPCTLISYNSIDSVPTKTEKYLDSLKLDKPIIISDPYAEQIIRKINKKEIEKFDKYVSVRKPYGFCTDIFNKYEMYKDYWIDKNDLQAYKIYGVAGKKGSEGRKEGWVKKTKIAVDVLANMDKWKLFFSKSFTFDRPYVTIPKIIVAGPKEICSETFLSIGCFDNKKETDNCLSYIRTKFWRYLFMIYWSGQIVARKNFSLIPWLDFKNEWTDKKLYKLFKLSTDEINYIENKIGEWKND